MTETTEFDFEGFNRKRIEGEERRAELGILRSVELIDRNYSDLKSRETPARDSIRIEAVGVVYLSRAQWQAFRDEVDGFYTREEGK